MAEFFKLNWPLFVVSISCIPSYDKNNYLPKPQILHQLSKFTDVSIDYLLWDNQEIQQCIDFKNEELLNLLQGIRQSLKSIIRTLISSKEGE